MIKKDKIDNSKECQRRSIRLKEYDYSQAGGYFVTICTYGGKCLLGNVITGEMRLSQYGEITNKFWHKIASHFPNAKTDVFVVMPNHIHGIIFITDERRGGVSPPHHSHQGEETSPLRKRTLGQIIAYFKYQTTKQVNQILNTAGTSLWQRNYYEHVIRDEKDLKQIREYIIHNPLKWELDSENPENVKNKKIDLKKL